MSSSKTTTAAEHRHGAKAPAGQAAGPKAAEKNSDAAIARAQSGEVRVTPETAVEMAGKLYTQGKYAQAEKVCRQLIAGRPANADAHNILGVTLQALGRGDEAIAMLRRAVELAPEAAPVLANFGEVLRMNSQADEACDVLERAVEIAPASAQAWNNLGIIRFERREYEQAADAYRKAIEARPTMAEAYNNLGNALRVTGDRDSAIEAYQDALTHRERYPEAYNNLGTLLQAQGMLDEAAHALRKAIAQGPDYIEAYNNLASVYALQKKDTDALRTLSEALKIAPASVPTLVLTARIQLRRNSFALAERAARAAAQHEPGNGAALTVLGQVLHELDRYQESLEILQRAVAATPDSPEALSFHGVALKSVGRLDEARESIIKGLRRNPRMIGAYANLNDLVDFSEGVGAELFDEMERIFEAAKDRETDAFIPLHFAYANGLEDRGEHERALEHYITGGRLKRAQLSYVESETHEFFDAIREAFPRSAFEERRFAGNADERPVFIVGMPRSGSTLVEQILSSHPDVYGAGEVKYLSLALGKLRDRFPSLPKYPKLVEKLTPSQAGIAAETYLKMLTASSGEASRVTDKLLTNYFFVGLIHLIFPKAKIIHTLRDPVDTCLSGFTKLFKDDMPHSYDLGELGRYYGKYRELMEHWQAVLPKGVLTTVRYEDVVADTEKEARALIGFLGLPWNDKCVDFHKSDRPVKTASVAQVRQPIYRTSVKRGEKYGAGLQPLVDAIEGKTGKTSKPRAKAAQSA